LLAVLIADATSRCAFEDVDEFGEVGCGRGFEQEVNVVSVGFEVLISTP